jgi:hypothetical protein
VRLQLHVRRHDAPIIRRAGRRSVAR